MISLFKIALLTQICIMPLQNPIMSILCISFLLIGEAVGSTDPGDYEILDAFRKGITNPDALDWPEDNQNPCGPPHWNFIFCSGTRVTQIQAKNLQLEGTLPSNLNKLSMLVNIGLQGNNLSGPLPSFKGLSNLQYAFLDGNQFDRIPADFFAGLDSLQSIALDGNPLNQSTGWTLPSDLEGSAQLTNLSLVGCNLAGPLPYFLGNMLSLVNLKLSYNRLTGEIPANYSGLQLHTLWLNNQNAPGLSGNLDAITAITFLNDVRLHGNQFSGSIPSSIGAMTSLTQLWLNNNKLVGLIPANLTDLPQLQSLHLDNNLFMGPIPKVSLQNFTYSSNSFCQSVPGVPCPPEVAALIDFLAGVGFPLKLVNSWSGNNSCTGSWFGIACSGGRIAVINLSNIPLNGTISPSLGELDLITRILLGGNNLNGTIPSSLTKLKYLKLLDLSSNDISPPVPDFPASVTLMLNGNRLLDGSNPSGTAFSSDSPGPSSFSKTKALTIGISVSIVVFVVALAAGFLLHRNKWKRNSSPRQRPIVIHPGDSSDPRRFVTVAAADRNNGGAATELASIAAAPDTHVVEAGNLVISVQVLREATRNFASENELGRGGFGVVYRGVLHDGTMIAVKRTESSVLSHTALDEFHAEIAVLSKVRHRHLVSILGYSVEDNERLLVYEYMPQGALSKHLFQWRQMQLEPLSWKRRLNIALDVARGIEYLHNFANQSFIHRDLKSSNILLGDDLRAKISDFGLAKLAPEGNHSVATKLAGTFGYLAPEYAVTGKVTTKVDVFSFGVVLMELLTGLKALDESRPDESRYLARWFSKMRSSRDKLRSIVDPAVALTEATFDALRIIAELAGHCTAREPQQRPDMGHAVSVLAPLVEKWRPASDEQDDDYLGIDLGQPLLQMVREWEEADAAPGAARSSATMDAEYSRGSIPATPAGFAESFTDMDGR